ncbi:MAG: hypothetical protein CSB55_05335 [Candidatus Cloacimonadota bacterium]|nr:MAG: hypothetical protein CSB55_05335 [Candidatus Cloacimonadota bacterium]
MKKFLVTFLNTHASLKAKKVFSDIDCENEFIPVPRSISSECGYSMLILIETHEKLLTLLEKEKIKIRHIYLCKDENGERNYEKING